MVEQAQHQHEVELAEFRGVQRVEPIPALRRAGAAVGIASVEIDRDQVVRRFPQDPDAFMIPDLVEALTGVDAEALADAEKEQKKQAIQQQFDQRSETILPTVH